MRITSAPSWARWSPQEGPAMNEAASTTRSPASTSCIAGRGDQRRQGATEKLAVAAAREGRDKEDLPRTLVGCEPRGGMGQDLPCIDTAAILPHHIGRDDADVAADPMLADGDLGYPGTVPERRLDLERRHAIAASVHDVIG